MVGFVAGLSHGSEEDSGCEELRSGLEGRPFGGLISDSDGRLIGRDKNPNPGMWTRWRARWRVRMIDQKNGVLAMMMTVAWLLTTLPFATECLFLWIYNTTIPLVCMFFVVRYDFCFIFSFFGAIPYSSAWHFRLDLGLWWKGVPGLCEICVALSIGSARGIGIGICTAMAQSGLD